MARGPKPVEVVLSEEQSGGLSRLISRHSTPQQIAMRARIIKVAAEGLNNAQIAREVEVSVDTVRKWRRRWHAMQAVPEEELSTEHRLKDEMRSGSPGKFSAEQIVQIVAIACEEPEASGYPVSHWTPKEVAAEAVKRGIVESISQRQVGRFLK
jgi:putative transposase